uniref:Uncharacterized protein n=1 Tax=uncultured Frankia sp. TaxID=181582 RepID=A0A6F8M0A9_9ACTN|nr:hypothetical protein LCDCFEPH_00003 [uncultured Frankia sp.]
MPLCRPTRSGVSHLPNDSDDPNCPRRSAPTRLPVGPNLTVTDGCLITWPPGSCGPQSSRNLAAGSRRHGATTGRRTHARATWAPATGTNITPRPRQVSNGVSADDHDTRDRATDALACGFSVHRKAHTDGSDHRCATGVFLPCCPRVLLECLRPALLVPAVAGGHPGRCRRADDSWFSSRLATAAQLTQAAPVHAEPPDPPQDAPVSRDSPERPIPRPQSPGRPGHRNQTRPASAERLGGTDDGRRPCGPQNSRNPRLLPGGGRVTAAAASGGYGAEPFLVTAIPGPSPGPSDGWAAPR